MYNDNHLSHLYILILSFLSWVSVFGDIYVLQLLQSYSEKKTKRCSSPFDLEAEMLEQINDMEMDELDENPADVSLPNMVNLEVNSPSRPSTAVKEEPVSSSVEPVIQTWATLPSMVTENDRKRTRSPNLFTSSSEVTRSVTLESETRSADTTNDFSEVRTPTPVVASPPLKVRRSTRNQTKN